MLVSVPKCCVDMLAKTVTAGAAVQSRRSENERTCICSEALSVTNLEHLQFPTYNNIIFRLAYRLIGTCRRGSAQVHVRDS